MIESSICFLDSGIGGLPYLEWVDRANTGYSLSYIADTANFPYGESKPAKVVEAVLETSRRIFEIGTPELMVLACNTASVVALEALREIAPCRVVGTVPAVKPAAELNSPGPIGVLATEGTVNSPYLDRLVESFAGHKKVIREAAGDIVKYVEERWLDEGNSGSAAVMDRALDGLMNSQVDSVVLGCTHFLHVVPEIERKMGPDVAMIDSRNGVGRRILSLLSNTSVPVPAASSRAFYVSESGYTDSRYRRFASMFGLEWMGQLK